jgi:hypothetical protein
MDWRGDYECTSCRAIVPVTVTELSDPRRHISEQSQKLLRDMAARERKTGGIAQPDPVDMMVDEMLVSNGKEALLHATCPRCGERNPAGVLERAKDRRRTRVIGTIASAAFAVGAWFFAWMGTVIVALSMAMTALLFVLAWRARTMAWTKLATNVAFTVAVATVMWFCPRAVALLPLVLAVRFAIYPADEAPWTKAKETLRFEAPYR